MDTIFKGSFNDEKGIECDHCMLQGTRGLNLEGETVMACYGLGIRPICPEEGKRKDCPLIIINKKVKPKKKKKCTACSGSGWYDSCDKHGNPIKCGACNGTGIE